MHTSIQNKDPLFRNEGGGDTILSVCYGNDSEYSLGDVAGEGMEFVGGGRYAVPDLKSSFYIVQ
jgi:hypothetical protein